MMKITKLFTLLVAAGVVQSAGAVQLDYKQAKELAVNNSKLLKAYEEEYVASKFRVEQANSGFLPKINLKESIIRTNEPGSAAFATMSQGKFDMNYFTTQLSNPKSVNNFETKIEIFQPVFANGKIYFGAKQAEAARDAAKVTVEKVRQDIILNLAKSFYGKALSDKALDVTKKSYQRTARYKQMTEDFYKNGLTVKSDLLVAESRLLLNDQAISEAEKQSAIVQSYLQRLIDNDEDIKIVWSDPEYKINESLDYYINSALDNRQDLKAMNEYLKISEYEIKKSDRNYHPEVSLFADYKFSGNSLLKSSGEGYTVGAVVNLNLFNGFFDKNKKGDAKSSYLAAYNKVLDKKRQITTEVKEAYFSVKSAEKKLEAAKKGAEAAYEALSIVERRFSEGLSKVTELLDREVELKSAELNVYFADYELITSRAALLNAAGVLN